MRGGGAETLVGEFGDKLNLELAIFGSDIILTKAIGVVLTILVQHCYV